MLYLTGIHLWPAEAARLPAARPTWLPDAPRLLPDLEPYLLMLPVLLPVLKAMLRPLLGPVLLAPTCQKALAAGIQRQCREGPAQSTASSDTA